MLKSEFPLLKNHPEIVYLDNAATTQKPRMVIDGVSEFVKNEYANIHRGVYALSEWSENHYERSKDLLAELFNCSHKEIIYTANATAAVNIMAQTLINSKKLKSGDTVLIGIWDHHADILPWMSLSKIFHFNVEFFGLKDDFTLDYDEFKEKYTSDVSVVCCAYVSNVTGGIIDVKKIKSFLRDDTFFFVDASQAAPNLLIDFQEMGCDAFVFTGHKMMAYTGIGGLILKYELLKSLEPLILGGGTIKDVSYNSYELKKGNEKYEAGTPDIIGAVSLEYALKFIQQIGDGDLKNGMKKIEENELNLAKYCIEKFKELGDSVKIMGPKIDRIALFSFLIKDHGNFNQIGEYFAENNICIRCGGHCAYPLHKRYHVGGTCRMSAYLYTDEEDIDKFFDCLKEFIKK